MKLFFLDDARQSSPSRAAIGSLIAVGGIGVSSDVVGDVEAALDGLCKETYGFPPGEQFKWSPGRDLWMRDNLVQDRRLEFFREVITCVRKAEAKATVVIEDCTAGRATDADTPELDVIRMCLERICNQCRESPPEGLVITDRTMGGHAGHPGEAPAPVQGEVGSRTRPWRGPCRPSTPAGEQGNAQAIVVLSVTEGSLGDVPASYTVNCGRQGCYTGGRLRHN